MIARLSGDEFAVALGLNATQMNNVDQLAEKALMATTRPFTLDDRIIQVGAFAGIASAAASEAKVPDQLRGYCARPCAARPRGTAGLVRRGDGTRVDCPG